MAENYIYHYHSLTHTNSEGKIEHVSWCDTTEGVYGPIRFANETIWYFFDRRVTEEEYKKYLKNKAFW